MNTDLLRHKILDELYNKHFELTYGANKVNSNSAELRDIKMSFFLKKYKVPELIFRKAVTVLVNSGEVSWHNAKGEDALGINNPGLSSLETKKYLKIRADEINDKYYRVTKWIIPILAIIFSAISLIVSITKKSNEITNIYLTTTEKGKVNTLKIDSNKISH